VPERRSPGTPICLPQPGRLVVAAGQHHPAVLIVGDRPDPVEVREDRPGRLARRRLPDSGRPVLAAGQDEVAPRAEGHGVDRSAVSLLERTDRGAGLDGPKWRGAIRSAGQCRLAVRAEGDGPDPTLLHREPSEDLTGPHVPEQRGRLLTGRERGPAVRAEGDGPDRFLVSIELREWFP